MSTSTSTLSNETTNDIRPKLTRVKTNSLLTIPPRLLKPGIEMLKVSAKSSRRVKSRQVWLEFGTKEMSKELELLDMNSVKRIINQDIKICWEKSGKNVIGSKREASIPLSSIRDLRFGTAGSSYRTSLHLSPLIEPRWLTLIYILPNSTNSLALLSANTTPSYKLVHFIAPSEEVLELWKSVLDKFRDGRVSGTSVIVAPGSIDSESEREEDIRVVKEEEVHRLCARLGMGMSRESVGVAFRAVAAPKDFLDFVSFQNFVKVLKKRTEIEEVFSQFSGSVVGMSPIEWKSFLIDTQKTALSPLAIDNLFTKYRDLSTGFISLDAFSSFLMSSDNPAIEDDSHQDMTRPLTEYYISSSHNTYLVGNQLRGESTIEGYIRALQQGCRCVELDVWTGDDGLPVITHGRTFTSSILARDALLAISQYAFLASSYPLILSLEIHCDVTQQSKFVEILIEILGDRLIKERIDIGETGELEKLPSPLELRGKVLVKAKDLFNSNNNINSMTINTSDLESFSSAAESSPSSDSDFKRAINAVRRTFDNRSNSPRLSSDSSSSIPPPITRRSSSLSYPPPPQQIVESTAPKPPLSPALASLLIYTCGVKARGFNKKETYLPNQILSFGENRLEKMLKDELIKWDFISHNRNHLTRGYPKGIRVTSTNYEPHHFWAVGVQLVAVNWQTFDIGMELNTALFARAGRSGYVLKPELLRKKGLEKDKDSLSRISNYTLNLEIISAQQLPRSSRENSSIELENSPMHPFVEISIFIPGQNQPIKRRTKVISGNAFNPIFHSKFSISFSCNPSIGMMNLNFLRLEVLNAKGIYNNNNNKEEGITLNNSTSGSSSTVGSSIKGEFIAAYTTGLGGLLPGYRHLPLYDSVGDQHLFSSLFINSSIVLDEK